MTRRAFRWADLFVLAAVLLLGLFAFLFLRTRGAADAVHIYVGGELYDTISLKNPPEEVYTVSTENGALSLTFRDGGVAVLHSDCPDGVCVRTGLVTRKGESIVCVPLGVTVTTGEGLLDGVTG